MLERIKAISRRRVIRDGAWAVVGQAGVAVATLAATRVTTEIVRPDVLGAAALYGGFVLIAKQVVTNPVLLAQFRFYPEFAARGQVGRLRVLSGRVLGRLTAALVAVTLLVGAVHASLAPVSWWVYVGIAGLLVHESVRTFEVNFLQAARRQRAVTVVALLEGIGRPAVMLLVVWLFGATPQAVLLGYFGGVSTAYLIAISLVHREGVGQDAPLPDGASYAGPSPSELWRYALPLAPLAILTSITAISDRYIIGGALGTDDVGIYTSAYALMSQPFLMVQSLLMRTLTPIYYKAVSDNDHSVERRAFRAWLGAAVLICGAGALAAVFLSDLVARFLLAAQYREGAKLMPWIALGYMFYVVGCVCESSLYARKRTGLILIGNALVAVTSIVAPLILLRRWGVVGVAAACPIYFGTMVVVMIYLGTRVRTLPWSGPLPAKREATA